MDEPTSSVARTEWPVEWQAVWGERNGPAEHLASWLVQGTIDAVGRLPHALRSGLIGTLSRLARTIDRRHVRAARELLCQALGELSERELDLRVLQAYRHFLRVVIETRRFSRLVSAERTLEHFDVEWTDAAREAVESSKGQILVTAHFGNWEAGLAAAPHLGFAPLYAVAKPTKNRPLSIAMQAERERRGIRLLPRRGAMQAAPDVIRAGGTIGMLLDHRARGRPFLAPFFGRPARCDRSAGVLMRRLRVPTLICGCVATGEPLSYRFRFYDVIQPEELAQLDPAGIAARLNRVFEAMILERPDQYFWLHDRYKDTPNVFAEPTSSGQDP